jgi:threonine synthase
LQQTVGEKVGIYAEAAAIASILGVERLKEEGEIKEGETVVSISTSSGLKDAKMTGERMGDVPVVDAKIESILKYI